MGAPTPGSSPPPPHSASLPPRIELMGFSLDAVTQSQALDHIAGAIHAGSGGWVVTPNLDILRRIVQEPQTRALCELATLRLADGMPLIWASRLRGSPLPERVPGSDLVVTLSERAAREGFRVYLLGGDPGVGDAAAGRLRQMFPAIQIVGVESPPFGFEQDATYFDGMAQRVVAASPHIVFVAVGFPKQERVIQRLRPLLPAAWWLGVGISFSFVTGDVQRAPKWIQKIGLEWFTRVVQEPRRLFKRYFVHGVPFAIRLLITSALRRA
jgi:N-acetylglucosaminyldiphosphoundecaprenol N-acetyl-beta-D-mannosaminyltransferase